MLHATRLECMLIQAHLLLESRYNGRVSHYRIVRTDAIELYSRREEIERLSMSANSNLSSGDRFSITRPVAETLAVGIQRSDQNFAHTVPLDIRQIGDRPTVVRHLPEEAQKARLPRSFHQDQIERAAT